MYDRTSAVVYGLLLRILGDAPTSERLLVEIYQDAASRFVELDDDRATTLLLAAARKRALRESGAAGHLELLGATAIGVAPQAPDSPPVASARAAIARLEGVDREMLELAYFGGHSPRAIATRLRLDEKTVQARLRAALQGLSHARPSTTTKEAVS